MLKDYVVRIAKHGEIRIRAASADEAARMAQQLGSASWDNFKQCVEVVGNVVNKNGKKEKHKKEARIKEGSHGKSLKEVIIQRNPEMRKYVDLDEDEIPF